MDRILTTHVGSLIRPPEVTEALHLAFQGKGYDTTAFEAALSEAVDDVVQRQSELGIDYVADGEMSKSSWIVYVYGRVNGVEERVANIRESMPDALNREAYQRTSLYREYRGWSDSDSVGTKWVCTGPISYNSAPLERDLANFSRALKDQKVVGGFVPAVAPGSIYWIENEYYASEDEMMWAFADALREEYKGIIDAGLQLQVDDAVMWHKLATIKLQGGTEEDYRRWAEPRVEALNYALRGIPEDRMRYHLCSGSNHGPHAHDAPLRDIIDLVLKVKIQAYLIEQGNAAHEHEWRIWEDVPLPDDKIVVPGVVTHHTEMVENPELVAQRLIRLAGLVGRERVMAGTDCGFSQSASTQRVPLWTQWAKLEALVAGARLASEALWTKARPAA